MLRRVAILPALLLLLASRAAADEDLTPDDRHELAWQEQTGHQLGDGRALVRVTWRRTESAPGGVEEWNPFETDGIGFILAEDERSWTVLGAEFEGEIILKLPSAAERPRQVERVDARTFGKLFLGDPDVSGGAASGVGLLRQAFSGPSLGACGEALLVARALSVRGEPALARRVLEAARGRLREQREDRGAMSLLACAREEDALSGLWRILLRFDDGKIPRSALRDDLVELLRRSGTTSHAAMARDLLRVLEQMLQEDLAHPQIDDAALAALSPLEQARELVWRLRDQDGGQFMQPGSPSVFFNWGVDEASREDSPAHRLVALGHHAIPVLIEALTDERLTRTVGYWRDFHFSHYVVRFADAAHEILRQITTYEPWRCTYTNASMFKDGEAANVQRAYRSWWEEAGAFDAPLKRLLQATGDARAEAVRALPDRDPGRVVTLAAQAPWGSGALWDELGLSRQQAVTLCAAVLEHSEHVRLRVAAAWMLSDLAESRGVDAMIALWERWGAEGQGDARLDPTRGEHVAAFLAACGDPRAVRALADGLGRQSAAERQLVLQAFATSGLGAVRGLSCDGRGIRESWHLEGEAARLAQELVLDRLTDLEVDPLRRLGRQDPLADLDPAYDAGGRIADLAVRVLGTRWPLVYVMPDVAVRPASEWEALRQAFMGLPRPSAPRR